MAPRFSMLCFLMGGLIGCNQTTDIEVVGPPLTAMEEAEIVAFCSRCHQSPRPEYLPKDRWAFEVGRGFDFNQKSPDPEPHPPSKDKATRYYAERAPKTLPYPEAIPLVREAKPRFRLASQYNSHAVNGPAVADITWQRLRPDGPNQILFAEMGAGMVARWDITARTFDRVGEVPTPCRLERVDFDNDGRMDFLVPDLGTFFPDDHDLGGVRWLRQQADGSFESIVLAEKMGRVADVKAADFTGDGRLDLLIAEFGMLRTGGLRLMEQLPGESHPPRFKLTTLDSRPGAMRLVLIDLNHDDRLDFIALITQEFEAVEAFVNQGDGRFESRPLCTPPDPGFGHSGMTAVDLDQDGDIDLLLTNGDMFDDFLMKPFHGVRWLENRDGEFTEHHLLTMPGTHGVSAGDLDDDGDLDLLVANFFPQKIFHDLPQDIRTKLPSAVWMEQTTAGQFVPHAIETGNPTHAAYTLADVDEDGDLDALLGTFAKDASAPLPPFVVFENTTRGAK